MLSKDLKIVNLNITEDHYEYKAMFRLCNQDSCMDIDMANLSDISLLNEIKKNFEIEEDIEVMKEIITKKIFDASNLESRISEGEGCCKETEDKKTQRGIDSLSTS